MLTLMRFLSCLCLLLCAACTPATPPVLTKYRTITTHLPAPLKRPCPKAWHKDGGPATVADLVDKGAVNEAALTVCSAQVAKIAELDKGN